MECSPRICESSLLRKDTGYNRIPSLFIVGDAYFPIREGTKGINITRYAFTLQRRSCATMPLHHKKCGLGKVDDKNWKDVWRNIVQSPSLESDIIHWYKVIHDVIPTNERLNELGRSMDG
jgi:hypothetical protein